MKTRLLTILVLAPAALARAQPTASQPSPAEVPATSPPSDAADATTSEGPATADTTAATAAPAPANPEAPLFSYPDADPKSSGPSPPRPRPQEQRGLLFAPTAYMLGAGEISSASALDTSGGAQLDLKLGLGGVAEFSIGATDHIRARDCSSCDARTVNFVPMARFVMGLPEHRLVRHQPALALGFQKSFTRDHDERSTRYATLYIVASKRLGTSHFHAGAMLWDGVIERDSSEVALHDGPVRKMLRPYGGFEVLARERSHVLMELTWNPELTLARDQAAAADKIRLRPMLSWGVRYATTPRVAMEAGVRVPDIGDANLLDAQIFAQLRLTSRFLADALEDLQRK
jgi:hypothetical protein